MGLRDLKANNRSDIFQTDQEDVRPLLPFLKPFKKVWEPAAGEGQIVNFLRSQGFDVMGTDIMGGFDFLSPVSAMFAKCDVIVTNPPFTKKDEFLGRCYALEKPFALLLPITAFDSKDRRRMFKTHGVQVLLPDRRAVFTTPSGKTGGSWFYCAWFCQGLNLPEQLTFAEAA